MNPHFPFPAKFDRDRIRRDIEDARKATAANERDAYLKSEGLRFIVEAPERDAGHVAMMAREIWGVGAEAEALFPQDLNPPKSLRGFYLVVVRGVAFGELGNDAYDLAYALLSGTDYTSVEPDFPYLHFPPPPGGGGAPPPPATRAGTDQAWALRRIRADDAWRLRPVHPLGQQDGRGIAIAHLDTGWTRHRDLDTANIDMPRAHDLVKRGGNAEDPLDYWGNPGHGTRTGSVMMSDGDVNYPIGTIPTFTVTGVARHATYIPVRCIEAVVVIYAGNVARAVRYATACKADIVSMSLGGFPLRALRQAIEDATASQLLVVCAAGNQVRIVIWPARYKASIALAATNDADQPWSGSSRGRKVDVAAPGEDVWVADPDPAGVGITQGSGTSYATALTAGTAALWLAFHSRPDLLACAASLGLTLQELFRANLRDTARVPAGWDSTRYGAGIVDALALLRRPPCGVPEDGAEVTPNHDHLDEIRAHARELLQARLGEHADPGAFEHEFAKIFLDEIHEGPNAAGSSPDVARRVIGARGSLTLRSLLGL